MPNIVQLIVTRLWVLIWFFFEPLNACSCNKMLPIWCFKRGFPTISYFHFPNRYFTSPLIEQRLLFSLKSNKAARTSLKSTWKSLQWYKSQWPQICPQLELPFYIMSMDPISAVPIIHGSGGPYVPLFLLWEAKNLLVLQVAKWEQKTR